MKRIHTLLIAGLLTLCLAGCAHHPAETQRADRQVVTISCGTGGPPSCIDRSDRRCPDGWEPVRVYSIGMWRVECLAPESDHL